VRIHSERSLFSDPMKEMSLFKSNRSRKRGAGEFFARRSLAPTVIVLTPFWAYAEL
jgi:hypothetical protein